MGISNLYRYRINGVIDTTQPVLRSIENIANSCSTWVSYDSLNGKWSVVINKAANSSHSFNDSNIIGGINVSGTGLTELYNSVEVEFPSRDVNDNTDYIKIEIPAEDRLANEPDNKLTINLPLSNEPIQATIVGLQELKQSRSDLIVEFTSDWSMINVQAGEVIDITSDIMGWNQKLFRVIKMEEVDDEGDIRIQFTCLAYDANIYDYGDLNRYERSNADGIITIGLLGIPSTPQVTKFELNSRPRLLVETTVPDGTDPLNPAGIVEGIEFWYYQIPAGELPNWEIVDDSTRVYTLYKTERPTGGATTFAGGTTVSIDIDNVNSGNFLIKARAVNSTTTGDFSDTSGLVEYIPTQTAGAIASNTAILDNAGNSIGGLAAANILMKLLGDYLGTSGSSMQDIVYNDSIGSINNAIGRDIANDPGVAECFAACPQYQQSDNLVLTTSFNSGRDLDIRFRLISPVQSDWIGWSKSSSWSSGGYQILTWGGDNTGTGSESVLINLTNFIAAFPTAEDVVFECRAFWYGQKGALVNTTADLYLGGTMSISNYKWINSGATASANFSSTSSLITTLTQSSSTEGDFIGYFVYNIPTYKASFSK